MTSRQGAGNDPTVMMDKHRQSRIRDRALEPDGRLAAESGFAGLAPSVDLALLLAVPLTTLEGDPRFGRDIVVQRTLLILIDAHRARPERSAAEIAWVQERLEPGIDLVLIWPGRALRRALAMPVAADTRMYLDVQGAVRRLVSPSGKRVAVVADPASGELAKVRGDSPIFAVRRGPGGTDERGGDGTIDLGDVYR